PSPQRCVGLPCRCGGRDPGVPRGGAPWVTASKRPPLLSATTPRCTAGSSAVLPRCGARIEGLDARLVAVGMLPTLSAEQLTVEQISGNPRYALLCRRMRAAHH